VNNGISQLKNIVIINDFNFVNGGVAQVAILTANELADRGYNVIFFSAVVHPQHRHLSHKVKQYATQQYDILNNPSRTNALLQGLWNRKAANALLQVLSEWNPAETIVHLHGWIKALSPSIGKVLVDSKFKVVCTLHDYFSVCPNGGFFNYKQNEICKLKPLSLQCICTNCDVRNYAHKLWRAVRQGIQQSAAQLPNGIQHFITVTKFSETILRPYLPAHAKIYQISNPVYSKVRKRADVFKKRLLYIGRISPEKGIELACEAAIINNVPLTVIGDGEQRTELEKKYPSVEFKGWLSSEAVFEEMQQATALVFSSLWYETQGLVVLEALSAGLPVIVADQCAASEYVQEGKNGFTFHSGNNDDLSAKIALLLNDMNKTEEMSRYAYAAYWEHPFTLEQHIASLTEVYSTILETSKVSVQTT